VPKAERIVLFQTSWEENSFKDVWATRLPGLLYTSIWCKISQDIQRSCRIPSFSSWRL